MVRTATQAHIFSISPAFADDLEEDIKEARYNFEKNTLQLAQLEELFAFDLDALEAQYSRGGLTRTQYEERRTQITADYEDRMRISFPYPLLFQLFPPFLTIILL